MLKKAVYFLVLGIFIYSSTQGLWGLYQYYRNSRDYQQVREIYQQSLNIGEKEDTESPNEHENPNEKLFDKLLEINPDTVAWIFIENSNIDYPVVQGVDNHYYLNINFNGVRNRGGAIFMDYRNNPIDFDQNTIIYGHRMRDGSMFAHLTKFRDKDFFNNNDKIYLKTREGNYIFKVYSIYVTEANSYYITPNFSTEEEYLQFLQYTRKNSIFKKEVELGITDKILTLSTCSYEFDNARLVVHAKLMEQK
ncbi:class B sortase [Anaerobranca gottschalkii]|uniref:Sortase B. Cysteine peptidase. MEROPS family C60B n=1 Tax=Anaerobranca gottschalkii DSM 13577 TaxID=1120990 RepID=A0A1I0CJI6_9FIRM|nr:class B sortase [Anaerobranca gottschalkii]SET19808.1 sortase B. Cysteine peptidase. MEROPS family C60B [Anaerobranca gottschalkii DSM 13577]